ncbi:MAG: hypothetical protein SNG14_08645 [Rikenellaceae bacterium]
MRYLYSILLALSLLFTVGCTQQRTLSDGQLALIFHDAFLANAYTTNKGINLDSLRLYEPIFRKYGYTVEEVQHTIGSFSTRKSARLSDVVEASIRLLEREGEALDYEVRVLDTLNAMAVKRTTEYLHRDSLIWVKDLRDTTELRLTFERPEVGSYQISFDYLVSSDDTTPKGHRTLRWLEVKPKPKRGDKKVAKSEKNDKESKDSKSDSKSDKSDKIAKSKNGSEKSENGSEKESKKEPETEVKSLNSALLNRGRVVSYNSSIYVEEGTERLEIVLARPVLAEGEPNIKIKNLSVRRILPTTTAIDSLYRELLPIKIFDDELLFTASAPSL